MEVASPPPEQRHHAGWLGLTGEIILITAASLVVLSLCAYTKWQRHRQWSQLRLMAFGQGTVDPMNADRYYPADSTQGKWGSVISRWWQREERTTSSVSSSRGSLQRSLLKQGSALSSGTEEGSGAIGWRIEWRDRPHQHGNPNYRRYERLRVLGRGGHGAAVLLRNRSSGDTVVCKELSLATLEAGHLDNVENEVRILASLSHPHVIEYRCSFPVREKNILCIMMEYAQGGTLADIVWVHSERKELISESLVLRWLRQLTSAVDHLHTNRVLHRDLKTQNVFLTLDQHVKLGDFGVSRVMSAATTLANTVVGTPYYTAPEVLQTEPYGRPADLWGLGIILYEMLALQRPFTESNLGAYYLLLLTTYYYLLLTTYYSRRTTRCSRTRDHHPGSRCGTFSPLLLSSRPMAPRDK